MKTEILIPSSGFIELYDDVPISLNYNIADIRNPEKRNADFSKTITVPGTDNNNKLLGHIFEIGVNRLFNPNHKASAEVLVDKVSVIKGILRLARIKTTDLHRDVGIEYELEIKGRLDDLFTSIKDRVITDITWSDLDHTWNKTNIFTSWSTSVGTGYVYPFIDYGVGILSATEREVISFRPATYAKEIWDRIFSYAGFQYSSTFLNTDFFKRLIIPFYNEKFVRTQAQIQNNIFRAHRNSNQSFTFSGFSQGGFNPVVANTIIYNDDSTAPSSDAGNNYSTITGKFTASEAGIYTFYSQNSVTFQHNSPAGVRIDGYFRIVKNGITPVSYSTLVSVFPLLPSPSSYTATNVPVGWTGFLNTGETIEVQTYFQIINPLNTTFPTVQANFIATNSYVYNALDPSYSFNSSLSYAQAVPQNMKMEDFIMAIIKRFNLYFEYDKDTPNKIYIEPRNDYYNTTVQDWSQKLDTSQDVLIEPMGALDSKRYIFKDKPDKDWLNEKYQSDFQQIKDESYGTRIVTVDNDFLKNDYVLESIFAPTPQYSEPTSDRLYPKIVKVDPVSNVQTPVTALPRLLYYSGLRSCQSWSLFNFSNNSGTSFLTYPHCGHIDSETTPTIDLCWGVPKEIYYQPPFGATYSNNNCFNRFWKQFIDEITDKDSSIVTAWFHLTPADISILDFRHIYRFGFQNYRLNKIYDYNPVIDSLTKCEFIKTKTTVPFVYENKPAIGGTGNPFPAEAAPHFPPFTTLNPVGPPKVVSEGHQVPPSASSGVIVSGGAKNIVGDNVKSITVIQSSGVTVLHHNVTIIQSSGITSTGDNQLWIYNTLISSGDIYHMSLGGCPESHTVAEMQAMATSGLINPCEEYLITDAHSNFGSFRGRGRTTTALAGDGVFITSGGIICPAQYDLTNDKLREINDVLVNNRFTTSTDSEGNCIINFPYNNPNYNNNNGSDFFITIDDINNATISRIDFGKTSNIQIITTSGDVILTDCNFGQLTVITINSSSILGCNVSLFGVISLTLNNESYSYKTLTLDESTFDKTRDVTGVTTFNFINAGYDEGFAGIFNLFASGGTESINTFSNFNFTHEVTFYGDGASVIKFMHDGANIFLKNVDAERKLVNAFDWVRFKIVANVAYEVDSGLYY